MTRKVDAFTKKKLNLMASDIARHIEHITDENLGTLIEVALQEQDMRYANGQKFSPWAAHGQKKENEAKRLAEVWRKKKENEANRLAAMEAFGEAKRLAKIERKKKRGEEKK